MKNFIINIIISFFIGVITFFCIGQMNEDIRKANDDSLRHNKFAYYINEYGFKENDLNHNWGNIVKYSILEKYNVDLWQGHHLFLSYLLKIGVNIEDLNKYYITIIIFILSFLTLSLNLSFKNPLIVGLGIIGFLFFFNLLIYNRILLSRPYLFTIILFLLVLIILYYKRYIWLVIIFLIGSFYHRLFYFLFIPIILYMIIYRLKLKENFKLISYPILGSIIGILIHTKSLIYLYFSAFTIFIVPIVQMKYGLLASEISAKSGIEIYIIGIIILFLNIYIYLILKNNKNEKSLLEDKWYIFINILTIIFFFASTLILRFIDFLFVIAIFNLIYLISKIINIENIKISKKINIFGSIIILIFIFIFQIFSIFEINNNLNYNISDKKKFFNDITKYIDKGSIISSNSIYDFYDFYYYLGNDYKYVMSMEYTFIYLHDKKFYHDLIDVTQDYLYEPKNKENDLYHILKNKDIKYFTIINEKTDYIVNRSLSYKIEQIKKDDRFILLYNYKNYFLWKLK